MPARTPVKASTQEHLDIEDIQDNLVILKDGSCCLILKTTAVNFDLLSETEQDAIIYAYAGLLNSLTFAVQIVIHSEKKDISSYLALLKQQFIQQKSAKLKKQIETYQRFVEKIVKENEVLDKKFYVVIPFSSLEMGVSQAVKKSVKTGGRLPFSKQFILQKAKASLFPKRDHLIRQFSRLGLQTVQLANKELIKLFYDLYNPEVKGEILASVKDISAFFVEPAFQKPAPVSTAVQTAQPEKPSPVSDTTKLKSQIDNIININKAKN